MFLVEKWIFPNVSNDPLLDFSIILVKKKLQKIVDKFLKNKNILSIYWNFFISSRKDTENH